MTTDPFVPNGTYKIRSVAFPTFVADLINAVPQGPISAYTDHDWNTNDKWIVENVGDGGNQITIQSVSVPSNYAYAVQDPGSSLVGSNSPDPIIWTVVKVSASKDIFYLQSPDAMYVWELPQGQDYENIVLVKHTAQPNTEWTFSPV